MNASRLPQLDGGVFITDAGLETDLIFNSGIDIPEFASFVLLEDDDGRQAIADYFERFVDIAERRNVGLILESPTWRSNPDWGDVLGYSEDALAEANANALRMMIELRDRRAPDVPVVISGCIGPRGDGYSPDALMTTSEAADYHRRQIEVLGDAGAEMVSALTMTHVGEAAGVAIAASGAGVEHVISFTVETDGNLPDGTPFLDAVDAVDQETGGSAAYFMLNCAHPDHFASALDPDHASIGRLRGLRANASRMSHEELDESEELDDGDPAELAGQYAELRERFPQLNVLGGCCGTDARHVDAIAAACDGH